MSIAERQDALETVNDWDELDTPEESAEVRPQEYEARPDPQDVTQERQPVEQVADPATPVAETQTETVEQQLARIAAENAELQRKIQDREWSDRGRFLAEQKKNQQLQEQIQALTNERKGEDDALRQQYDSAIAQQIAAGNEVGAERLRDRLEAQLAKRELARLQQDLSLKERQSQELVQAQAEHERTSRGRQVQAAFVPMLLQEAQAAAQHFGLDESDAQDLLAFAAPKSLRSLAPNAPPEVLGQLAKEQYGAIIERAQALQARRVRQNQQGFDTTRERTGNGASRDLAKEFDEADDWDAGLAAIDAGYVEPQSRHRGARRR